MVMLSRAQPDGLGRELMELSVCRPETYSGSSEGCSQERLAKTPGSTPCCTLKWDLYCP